MKTLARILAPRTNPERGKLPTELPLADAAGVYLRRLFLFAVVVVLGAVVLLFAVLIDRRSMNSAKLGLGFLSGLLLSSLFRNAKRYKPSSTPGEDERLRQEVADLRRRLGMQ